MGPDSPLGGDWRGGQAVGRRADRTSQPVTPNAPLRVRHSEYTTPPISSDAVTARLFSAGILPSHSQLPSFQFEAWLHAEVPRVACTACGKTTQVPVPWARAGSGFTLLFEALSLTLCQGLPVRQAAQMLRVRDKQLWRRIEHYVTEARRKQDMSAVRLVGIDETKLRVGQA